MTRLALHWKILASMLIGSIVGIVLNQGFGTRQTTATIVSGPVQVLGMASSVAVPAADVWIEDTPNQVLIRIDEHGADHDQVQRRHVIVRGPVSHPTEAWPDNSVAETERYTTVDQLKERDKAAYALLMRHGRSWARYLGNQAQLIGDLFLRMLKMVSIPLIMTSLVSGVLGLGQAERLGRMFSRTLCFYIVTSLFAIVTGLVLVNVIQPGGGQHDAVAATPADSVSGTSLGTVLFEQLLNLVPTNPFAAAADGSFLSIIAFSILFGVFATLVGGRPAELVKELADACFQVMMRMTMAIVSLAPVGVFFLILSATATQGAGVFATLGWYMATVAIALATHACVTLPIIVRVFARRSPLAFARAMSPALLTAFSSASSNGTLPLTMSCVEENAGISNRTSSFVLPLGATVNMDGTALYEVVAVMFIAQHSGIELPVGQQLVVAFTALIASVGAAGIPHAGLVMMLIILQAVGLPVEQQGLIIAVDRVLDMARTAVNVWSDACGCAVIDKIGESNL